jgi:hypothetical protein
LTFRPPSDIPDGVETLDRPAPDQPILDRYAEILAVDRGRLTDMAYLRRAYYARMRLLVGPDGSVATVNVAEAALLSTVYDRLRRDLPALGPRRAKRYPPDVIISPEPCGELTGWRTRSSGPDSC